MGERRSKDSMNVHLELQEGRGKTLAPKAKG